MSRLIFNILVALATAILVAAILLLDGVAMGTACPKPPVLFVVRSAIPQADLPPDLPSKWEATTEVARIIEAAHNLCREAHGKKHCAQTVYIAGLVDKDGALNIERARKDCYIPPVLSEQPWRPPGT